MIHSKRFVIVAAVMAMVFMMAGAAWSQKGDDQPGWLGVTIQDMTSDLRDALPRGTEDGVLISNVAKDSPADEAGLKDGDIITRFNRETVRDTDHLTRAVREAGAGARVDVEYYRDGRRMRDRITLSERPDKLNWTDEDDGDRVWVDDDGEVHDLKGGKHRIIMRDGDEPGVVIWEDEDGVKKELKDGRKNRIVIRRPRGGDDEGVMVWRDKDGKGIGRLPDDLDVRDLLKDRMKFSMRGPKDLSFVVGDRPKLGVMLMDLGDQLAEYFGANEGGALVSEVMKDSPAEKAGMKAGDVIAAINDEPVEDAGDVSRMLRRAKSGDQVQVKVIRKGRTMGFEVAIDDTESEWYSAGPDHDLFFKRFGDNDDPDLRLERPEGGKYRFFGPGSESMDSELKDLRDELRELRKELSELKARRP